MPKKPGTNPKGEFAFFNVLYEDGSQRSNRRVPAELLGGLDGDAPAHDYILEQDRGIAEKSGRTPPPTNTPAARPPRSPRNPAGHRCPSRASAGWARKRSKPTRAKDPLRVS